MNSWGASIASRVVAVCCSVLQCVAVFALCCIVLRCVAVCRKSVEKMIDTMCESSLERMGGEYCESCCCSVLQRIAVLQCVAMCCGREPRLNAWGASIVSRDV